MAKTRLQKAFAPLKTILPQSIWKPLRGVATAVLTPVRFSALTGHWKSSLYSKALLPSGAAIPWYTYPAIDFLSQRSFEGREVLEFGAGQSTRWWADRAKRVVSIEENMDWDEAIRADIPGNVELYHVPLGQFERIPKLLATINRKFDVIIVDGHLRREATALAFDYISSNGALILDNAEGYGFYDETKDRKCQRVDFFGFAPGVVLRHCTSIIFFKDCFLFDPKVLIPHLERLS